MDVFNLIKNTDFEHNRTVSKISGLMAKKAGLPDDECNIVSQAALCHDIGKTTIPHSILNKPSSLTPEEYEIVKTHTVKGYLQLIEAVQALSVAAAVAMQHHEYMNGLGYHRFTGKDIHPYAKLISVADVCDALISVRPYKEAWGLDRVKAYFKEKSGKQFDCDAVQLLFSILDDVVRIYRLKR